MHSCHACCAKNAQKLITPSDYLTLVNVGKNATKERESCSNCYWYEVILHSHTTLLTLW